MGGGKIVLAGALALVLASCGSSKSSSSSAGGCPDGTTLQGKAPPEGTLQWCAKSGGVKHGPWTEWYAGGSLKSKGQYADGKMTGTWVSYFEPKPAKADGDAGPPPPATTDSPVKKEEGAYDKGLKTGEWTLYYEDGKVNRVKKHSPDTTEIPWVTWRPTGQKWAEGTIVGMRNHGAYKEWHPHGKMAAEGTYDKGEKVGEWKYWDVDGNPSTDPQGDLDVDPGADADAAAGNAGEAAPPPQ